MPLTSQYEAFLSLVAYILINWPHQNYANKIDSVPRFHHKNEHAMQPSFQPVCHLVLFVCLFVLSCCFLVTFTIVSSFKAPVHPLLSPSLHSVKWPLTGLG